MKALSVKAQFVTCISLSFQLSLSLLHKRMPCCLAGSSIFLFPCAMTTMSGYLGDKIDVSLDFNFITNNTGSRNYITEKQTHRASCTPLNMKGTTSDKEIEDLYDYRENNPLPSRAKCGPRVFINRRNKTNRECFCWKHQADLLSSHVRVMCIFVMFVFCKSRKHSWKKGNNGRHTNPSVRSTTSTKPKPSSSNPGLTI